MLVIVFINLYFFFLFVWTQAAALPPVQLVPKLTRGMQLRTAISGYGVVVINGRSYLVYRIAVAPRNTSKIWHVFRRYSEFVRLRKELIALVISSRCLFNLHKLKVSL